MSAWGGAADANGHRPSLARVSGVAVAIAGIACLGVLSVKSTLDFHPGFSDSIYSRYDWALVFVVIAAGLCVAVGSRTVATVSSVAGAVAAAQLVGVGAVAHEKWYPYFGPRSGAYSHAAPLERFALAMAVLCLIAVVVFVACLAAEGAFSVTATPRAARAVLAVLAVAIAVGVVNFLTEHDNGTDHKTVAALLALYGIPWGGAIGAAGWLRPTAALTACLSVTATASLAALCESQWASEFNSLIITGRWSPAFPAAAAAGTAAAFVVAVAAARRQGRLAVH